MLRPPAQALALACTLLGACDRGTDPAAANTTATTATAVPCDVRVAAMRDVFTRIPEGAYAGATLESDRTADLVTSDRAQPYTQPDVRVYLRPGGEFVVDDNSPGDRAMARLALDDALVSRLERRTSKPGADNPYVGPTASDVRPADAPGAKIQLFVAPAAPIAELLELLRQVAPGNDVSLVVRDPQPPLTESDLPPPVLAALRASDVRNAGPRLTSAPPPLEAMMTCPEFRPLLTRTAFAGRGEREREWLKTAPDLALACKCDGVDVEGLTAVTWQRTLPDLPTLRLLPLRWSGDPADLVTLPKDAKGADLVRQLEARGDLQTHFSLAP
jgi:hypothetical protein